jgi:hypothetical protein
METRERADRLPLLPQTLKPGMKATRAEQLEFQRICASTAYRLAVSPSGKKDGSIADVKPGKRLLLDIIDPLTERIELAKAEAMEALTEAKSGSGAAWHKPLMAADPWFCAAVTADAAVRSTMPIFDRKKERWRCDGINFAKLALDIGTNINLGLMHGSALLEMEKLPDGDKKRVLGEMGGKPTKMRPARWRKWNSEVASKRSDAWDDVTRIRFGERMLALLIEATADPVNGNSKFWTRLETRGKKEEVNIFHVRPDIAAALLDPGTRADAAPPRLNPMLILPESWHYREDGQVVGGYLPMAGLPPIAPFLFRAVRTVTLRRCPGRLAKMILRRQI